MTYHYRAFGLNIISDIVLPELVSTVEVSFAADVRVSNGKVPATIINANEKHERCQIGENQFLFTVPGVGRYYVSDGNSIIVEPSEEAEGRLRLFLLGTAFGGLLMQRGILPVHGSAVVVNGCCVIFTGVSGVGKSTLLAAYRELGYPFLTDDVAAVTVDDNGVAWVHSAYPQQKLWQDSAQAIGVDTTSLTPFYSGDDRDKFAVPIHRGFCQTPVPLAALYELGVENCRDVTLRQISGVDKLAVLMRHTYRPWLIEGLGKKAEHFKQCTAVAKHVAVSSLTRPRGVFSTTNQIRLVQQDLERLLADKAV